MANPPIDNYYHTNNLFALLNAFIQQRVTPFRRLLISDPAAVDR
ncbi:hypothetical protein [Spirosoma pollinicola]|nr:hypothetical protein [Spirosoma pollinicola]